MFHKLRVAFCWRLLVSFYLAIALNSIGSAQTPESNLAQLSQGTDLENLSIPLLEFEKHTLKNGLTLIVHTDHSSPLVTVNVTYRVGSAQEYKGFTGFAHLFEHLMFNGSGNFSGEYISEIQKLGGRHVNGTTNRDRTNYYQTVPTQALERVLWLESDRMGHLLGGVTAEELDVQRSVVLNEKWQREQSSPFGPLWGHVLANLYPDNHPYSWPTIGYEEDIRSADLESIATWFHSFYAPRNAIVTLAGDITSEDAVDLVTKYFGSIPKGLKSPKTSRASKPRLADNTIVRLTANTPYPRNFYVWPIPNERNPASMYLLTFCQSYINGGGTPIWEKLVRETELANSLSCDISPGLLGGEFIIGLEALDEELLSEAAQLLQSEIQKVMDGDIDPNLLQLAQINVFSSTIRNLDANTSKASIMAAGQLEAKDPLHYVTQLGWLKEITPKSLKKALKRYINNAKLVIRVDPDPDKSTMQVLGYDLQNYPISEVKPKYKRATYEPYPEPVDRSQLPGIGSPDDSTTPKSFTKTLYTGMNDSSFGNFKANQGAAVELWFFPKKDAQTALVELQYGMGSVNDPKMRTGLADFTSFMLSSYPTSIGVPNTLFQRQGATFDYSVAPHTVIYRTHTLKETWKNSFQLLLHTVIEPREFKAEHLANARSRWLANLELDQRTPRGQANLALPRLLFPESNPYHHAINESGLAEHIKCTTLEDLIRWQTAVTSANPMRLIITGDFQWEEVLESAENILNQYPTNQRVAEQRPKPSTVEDEGKVFLIDQKSSKQALIMRAALLPPELLESPHENALIDIVNHYVGGGFSSRMNSLLREEKGWTYGARSYLKKDIGQPLWISYASTQKDAVADSLKAMESLFGELGDATTTEISAFQRRTAFKAGSGYETPTELHGWASTTLRLERPLDFSKKYVKSLTSQTAKSTNLFADTLPQTQWISLIVGNADELQPQLALAGYETTLATKEILRLPSSDESSNSCSLPRPIQ